MGFCHEQNPVALTRIEAPGATAGLVLGILSMVLAERVLLGFMLAWVGFQKSKSAKELCTRFPDHYGPAGVAQAEYICSIAGICLGAIATIGVRRLSVVFPILITAVGS